MRRLPQHAPGPNDTLRSFWIRLGFRYGQDVARSAGFSSATLSLIEKGDEGFPKAKDALCRLLRISRRQLDVLVAAGVRAVRS